MASATSNFLGSGLPTLETRPGRGSRSASLRTEAFFSKVRKQDKKEVERAKNSEVVKAKKLLPYDVKWTETQAGRGFKQDSARNTPREGGFGQGLPYQKVKIGQKMEGTPVPSNISPIAFVAVLAVVTIVLSLALIN